MEAPVAAAGMKIGVPPSLVTKAYLPNLRQAIADAEDVDYRTHPSHEGWILTWAGKERRDMNGVTETGFFYQSMWIDGRGGYGQSALSTPEGITEIHNFEPPRSIIPTLLEADSKPRTPNSKYRSRGEDITWDGVVLALQTTNDRSVKTATQERHAYVRFVEKACARFGPRLYLKLHPLQPDYQKSGLTQIARKHGSRINYATFDILRRCKFVLVYNSGFAVDCMIRGVPVAQYAPGFWHKTGAVTYTAGEIPDDVEDTVGTGYQLVDFLAWRYCFCWQQPGEQWVRMLRRCAENDAAGKTFLLDQEFSYAENMQYRSERWLNRLNM